ncbi:MAG: hypothetical protein DMF92_15895, partial [Acidobacteria bacterium]
ATNQTTQRASREVQPDPRKIQPVPSDRAGRLGLAATEVSRLIFRTIEVDAGRVGTRRLRCTWP